MFHEVQGVVDSVVSGFNGTVLSYGQTSAGKSFTMEGPNTDDSELKGIIPRAMDSLYDVIERSNETMKFEVKVIVKNTS